MKIHPPFTYKYYISHKLLANPIKTLQFLNVFAKNYIRNPILQRKIMFLFNHVLWFGYRSCWQLSFQRSYCFIHDNVKTMMLLRNHVTKPVEIVVGVLPWKVPNTAGFDIWYFLTVLYLVIINSVRKQIILSKKKKD